MIEKKILIWGEPHPIRNTFTEFLWPTKFFVEAFSKVPSEPVQWKVFSNQYILSEITKLGIETDKIIYPTESEEIVLNDSLHEWTNEQIEVRNDIIAGRGEYREFYLSILERINAEYAFDAIFMWSENGLVRSFAEANGVVVFHCELGPTRKPFPETFYVDRFGTNGSASLPKFLIDTYPEERAVESETWLSLAAGAKDGGASVFEQSLSTAQMPVWKNDAPYVIVALQLADDLNMIDHSDFSSPLEFLEYVLPPLIRHGYQIFVKGHPGSVLRPQNLVKELEAINYAKSLGDSIEILDRHLNKAEYLSLTSRAAAVVSINSSVSCEALLLNIPGVLFGHSAFDAGGMLLAHGQELLKTGRISVNPVAQNKLLTILFRHYLHPFNSDSAARIFELLCTSEQLGKDEADFVAWIIQNTDYGTDYLDQELNHSRRLYEAQSLIKDALPLDKSFKGHIDKVLVSEIDDAVVCEVQGWAGRAASEDGILLAGVAVMPSNFVSLSELYPRNDVQSKLPDLPLNCGFHVKARFPEHTSKEDIKLVFVTTDGAYYHPIDRKAIQSPPSSVVEEVLPDAMIHIKRTLITRVKRRVLSLLQ